MRLGINTSVYARLKTERDVFKAIDIAAIVEEYAPKGVAHVELSCDLNMMLNADFNRSCIARIDALRRKHGFTCSVHLPFRGLDPSYPSRDIAMGYARMMAGLINLTERLEPLAYVVHTSGPFMKLVKGFPLDSPVMGKVISTLEWYLAEMVRLSGVMPGRIALENLGMSFAVNDAILRKHPYGVCMDAGHLMADNAVSGQTVDAFLAAYGTRLAAVHLHDVVFEQKGGQMVATDHMPLDSGSANWRGALRSLAATGYEGYVLLEVKPDTAAQWASIEAVRAAFPQGF